MISCTRNNEIDGLVRIEINKRYNERKDDLILYSEIIIRKRKKEINCEFYFIYLLCATQTYVVIKSNIFN